MALPNGDLITTVFDPQMAYPVDKRMQVDTLNSRDSISMFIRWEGMTVYVLENSKIYILQGGRSNEFWKELGTGTGTGGTTFVGQFESADLLPTSGRSAGDYAFVGTGDDFVQYNWDSISGQWIQANQGAVLRPNGVVQVGSATINDNSVDLDNQWIWTYDNVNYQKTTATNIPIPAATSGYFRLDWIVGNTSNGIERIAGTESDTTAIAPVVPVDMVPLVQVFVDENGIQYIEEQALSTFVRYDIATQGLSSSQRLNARLNIQAVSKDTADSRTGALTQNGLLTVNGDYVQVVSNNTASARAWQFSNPSGGGAHFQRRGGLSITAKGDSVTNYFILRGFDNTETEVFRVRQGGVTKGGDAINADDFATLGQVQALIEISEETDYTEMSADDFFIGYRVDGEGERIEQIFDKGPKDVIVTESGDFVFAPETSVARFIFTGEVTAIRGIETAAADREIKLVNRTGSDITLRDKASGIPSDSGFDFGGTDYTWVNGSEITLKGNGTYWELAPNNEIAFSDHLDSVNAQVSVGSDGLQVINGLFDNITKQEISIKETNEFVDGSPMNDTKVDGFVFRKLGNKFFVDTDIWTNLKINPKKFGAKGDGITDDTNDIKAAFLIAEKLGASIHFPSGIFKVTDTIPMFATCSINGAGIEKTVILSHLTDNKHVFEYINTSPITFNRRGIRVSNICVKGKTNLLTATDGYAFVFGGLYENSFDNVQVRFMGGGAIWAKEGVSNFVTKVTNCDFNFNSRNIYWRNIDMGVIHWEYSGGTNGLNVINTYISNNAGMHGIYYIGLAGRFISTTIESGLDGIRLGKENFPHTAAITMVGCYFENNNVDINVVEALGVNVSSSYFSVSSDISIQIYRLRGGNFTNNRFGSSSNGVTVLQGAGSNSFGWREDIKFENNSNLKFIGSPDLSGITVVDGIYENNPYGGFGSAENLISESDNFDNWVKIGTPTLVKDDVFLDGREAYTLTKVTSGTEILYLPIVANEGDEITFSVYISCTERCFVRFRGLRISDGVNENFNGQYVNTNGKWQKISLSTTVSHTDVRLYIDATNSGVKLCRANLNRGLVASKSIFTNGTEINEVSAVSNGDHYFAGGTIQKSPVGELYRKKVKDNGFDLVEKLISGVWTEVDLVLPSTDYNASYMKAEYINSSYDLNELNNGGIKSSGSSTFVNSPGAGYWIVQYINGDNATGIQTAWKVSSDEVWTRRRYSGSWHSWVRIGGISTFSALTDTPANYTGHKNKSVKVNNEEAALVFVADGVEVRNITDGGSIAPTLTSGFMGSRLNFTSSTAVTLQGFTSAGGQSSLTLVNPHATNNLTLVHNGAGTVKYIDAGATDLVIAPKTAVKLEIVGNEIYRVL